MFTNLVRRALRPPSTPSLGSSSPKSRHGWRCCSHRIGSRRCCCGCCFCWLSRVRVIFRRGRGGGGSHVSRRCHRSAVTNLVQKLGIVYAHAFVWMSLLAILLTEVARMETSAGAWIACLHCGRWITDAIRCIWCYCHRLCRGRRWWYSYGNLAAYDDSCGSQPANSCGKSGVPARISVLARGNSLPALLAVYELSLFLVEACHGITLIVAYHPCEHISIELLHLGCS